ncbi:MAG: helix-turn-helix domain-containing protein [Nitrososphaerales archaeon]
MKKLDPIGPHLAPRELQILELLINGYRDKEIAKELGLATKSVSNRLSGGGGIFDKLGVRGRVEATRQYILDYSRQLPPDPEPQRVKAVKQVFELRDHIGLWCARCLGYLEPRESGEYHPYSWKPLVDDLWLQVVLQKVVGWTVPVHRDGCPSATMFLNIAGAHDRLNSLVISSNLNLGNLANTTFYGGNLPLNIVILFILSHRRYEEERAIDLVKASIRNAGSRPSEVIGPILRRHMPSILSSLDYQRARLLLALGNRARNVGDPDYAEKCYGQARYIINKMLPKEAVKPRHAILRRELSVSPRGASAAEAERLIKDAEGDAIRWVTK